MAKRRNPIPVDLNPDTITAIIDTREQLPLDLSPIYSERGTLPTGDYSIKGLENVISYERKSLTDFLGCCGGERERFERELQRMRAYETCGVIIEATLDELKAGNWAQKVTPESVLGSIYSWSTLRIPFYFVGDSLNEKGEIVRGRHQEAGVLCARLMFLAARRRWRESRGLLTGLDRQPGEEG